MKNTIPNPAKYQITYLTHFGRALSASSEKPGQNHYFSPYREASRETRQLSPSVFLSFNTKKMRDYSITFISISIWR